MTADLKFLAPPQGAYHCAFPDFGGIEEKVTQERIDSFVRLAGKQIVWAYFSNNWFTGIEFPENSIRTVHRQGIMPYVRLMARSTWVQGRPDPVYKLQRIIDGEFDAELLEWAAGAKRANIPFIVEFGTEVNGDWFPWNGKWNGGGVTNRYGDPALPDGPERFRDAYRHIVKLFRSQGVQNITWVYHCDAEGWPETSWNTMTAYYPGDEYVDWIGISVYGPQKPGAKWQTFIQILDKAYPEFSAISPDKPLAVLEFGVVDDKDTGDKAAWIRDALQSIKDGRYPRIKAVSYWHSTWRNNNGTVSDLRIDSSPAALAAYREEIADPFFLTKAYRGKNTRVNPTGVRTLNGVRVSGDSGSLQQPDGQNVYVVRSQNQQTAVIVDFVIDWDPLTIQAMQLKIRWRSDQPETAGDISLFNFRSGQYEELQQQSIPSNFVTRFAGVSGSVSRFVGAEGVIRLRLDTARSRAGTYQLFHDLALLLLTTN